jgi:FkbM family methyltransferase
MAEGNVDSLVYQAFFSRDKIGRVVIEVGAARPDFLSISAYFRSLEWNVLAIEPNPAFCELHRKSGYEVLQYACGDHDEDEVDFTIVESLNSQYGGETVTFESFSSLGVRGAYLELAKTCAVIEKKIKVKLRRLDTILEIHAPNLQEIDILAIDVEGWELQVMQGLSVSRYRPKVLIVENLFGDPSYNAYMEGIGYALWQAVFPNQVYVLNGWHTEEG